MLHDGSKARITRRCLGASRVRSAALTHRAVASIGAWWSRRHLISERWVTDRCGDRAGRRPSAKDERPRTGPGRSSGWELCRPWGILAVLTVQVGQVFPQEQFVEEGRDGRPARTRGVPEGCSEKVAVAIARSPPSPSRDRRRRRPRRLRHGPGGPGRGDRGVPRSPTSGGMSRPRLRSVPSPSGGVHVRRDRPPGTPRTCRARRDRRLRAGEGPYSLRIEGMDRGVVRLAVTSTPRRPSSPRSPAHRPGSLELAP